MTGYFYIATAKDDDDGFDYDVIVLHSVHHNVYATFLRLFLCALAQFLVFFLENTV